MRLVRTALFLPRAVPVPQAAALTAHSRHRPCATCPGVGEIPAWVARVATHHSGAVRGEDEAKRIDDRHQFDWWHRVRAGHLEPNSRRPRRNHGQGGGGQHGDRSAQASVLPSRAAGKSSMCPAECPIFPAVTVKPPAASDNPGRVCTYITVVLDPEARQAMAACVFHNSVIPGRKLDVAPLGSAAGSSPALVPHGMAMGRLRVILSRDRHFVTSAPLSRSIGDARPCS